MTIRGQILVSSTDDDPLPSVCVWIQNGLRVSIQNVPVCTGSTRTCFNTCARGAGIHGDVLNVHTVTSLNPHTGFSTFFSACRNTHKHTHEHTHTHQTHHQTTPRPQRHTTQNTTHNITRRQSVNRTLRGHASTSVPIRELCALHATATPCR